MLSTFKIDTILQEIRDLVQLQVDHKKLHLEIVNKIANDDFYNDKNRIK